MAFVPNWSPTAYYNTLDKVIYIDTPYQLIVAGNTPGVFGVPPPSNPTAWIISSTGGGVTSLSAGARTLVNAVTLTSGTGISLGGAGQDIQINNLNPAVVQQGIIALADSVGTQTIGFQPSMLTSLTSTAGSAPSATFVTTNQGVVPTATSQVTLNLNVPPVPIVAASADAAGAGLIVTPNSPSTGNYTIGNNGIISINGVKGVSGATTLAVSGSGLSLNDPGTGTFTFSNTGVTSLIAGTGISVSQATGDITVSATPPTPTPILSRFTQSLTDVGLSGSFLDYDISAVTSTVNAAVLNVWGTINLQNTTLLDAVVDVRLNINGVVGTFQKVTIPAGHFDSYSIIGSGTTQNAGVSTGISIQARESSGNAIKTYASLLCIVQTTLTV